ncbi:MAG: hypothetical protein EAZ43_00345 [Betaproteobacteria bacterium]|nr:MAG: hypothetical protein EAZ43_00345 [Betaproteobacteria bacterium]
MNTKQILIATIFAATSVGAFASDMDASATSASNTASVQVAQANNSPVLHRIMGTSGVATLSNCAIGYSEAATATMCFAPDTRTRAEVRAETLKWVATRNQRGGDSYYVGGAQ